MLHRLECLAAKVKHPEDAETVRWALAKVDQYEANAAGRFLILIHVGE
jgi:hypothetical protein